MEVLRTVQVYSLFPSAIGACYGYILSPLVRLVPYGAQEGLTHRAGESHSSCQQVACSYWHPPPSYSQRVTIRTGDDKDLRVRSRKVENMREWLRKGDSAVVLEGDNKDR
eukprot:1176181-Prorocentrum_minimum.AAC.1